MLHGLDNPGNENATSMSLRERIGILRQYLARNEERYVNAACIDNPTKDDLNEIEKQGYFCAIISGTIKELETKLQVEKNTLQS